jgi:hypothetical protein
MHICQADRAKIELYIFLPIRDGNKWIKKKDRNETVHIFQLQMELSVLTKDNIETVFIFANCRWN